MKIDQSIQKEWLDIYPIRNNVKKANTKKELYEPSIVSSEDPKRLDF